MKFSVNYILGIGGVISMVISPVLAFGGLKTDVEVDKIRITALEKMEAVVYADHDLLIQLAAKHGIDTTKAVSLSLPHEE